MTPKTKVILHKERASDAQPDFFARMHKINAGMPVYPKGICVSIQICEIPADDLQSC